MTWSKTLEPTGWMDGWMVDEDGTRAADVKIFGRGLWPAMVVFQRDDSYYAIVLQSTLYLALRTSRRLITLNVNST